MAGPTASILLAQILTDEQRLSLRNAIADLSDHVEGDDFWIQGRPFIVILGPEYEGQYEEQLGRYVTDGLPGIMGWTPKDMIGFAAMCNSQVDHRLLGELCLRVARSLDGVIDFGGELPASAMHGHGTLFTVPYQAAAGHECRYHVGNAEFLEWWLKQPDFRMIK